MAKILKGAPVAKTITENMAIHAQALKVRGVFPKLAFLRIGEREDDVAYENGAIKRMETIGIEIEKIHLPADSKKETVLDAIKKINEDDSIHGCIMFRPLLDKDTEDEASRLLDPAKDVDGMTPGSMSSLFMGGGVGFPPCTAQACIALLKYYGYELSGKKVVVIGRSLVIGRPVAIMLTDLNATVTVCHSKSKDIPDICKDADVIVAAVGKAGFVDKSFVRSGQTVVDVGINVDENGQIKGDVAFDEVEKVVDAITPVPAGIGSLTTSILASHVISSCERKHKI